MADISTANLDAGGDSPRLARAQVLEAVQRINGLTDDSDSSKGAGELPALQPFSGAVARKQRDKNAETISVMDFGATGDNVADDTAAFQAAISAVVASGGWGVLELPPGKTYKLTALAMDGVIGLTLRGKNGGNVGNLAPGSTGGASFLRFTNTTGDCMAFTGIAYHAAKVCLQDLVLCGNTSGNVLSFDDVSEIHLDRISVTNAGGDSATTGNGIAFSNCYYVYANGVSVWKTGTLYTVGRGVTINKGAEATFLGGLYNFKNCSAYGWQTGLLVGSESPSPIANENYANVNWIESEFNGNSIGAALLYGVKAARIEGSYIEGNLQFGVWIANQAQSVTVAGNFFNNFSAAGADLQLGLTGAGTSYPKFTNVAVRDNLFLGTNIAGIDIRGAAGNSVSIDNNRFTLYTSGSVAIKTNQPSSPAFLLDVARCTGYGYAAGNVVNGGTSSLTDCAEFDLAGVPTAMTSQGVLRFTSYPTDYQLTAQDVEVVTIINTRSGAKLLAPNLTFAKGGRFLVVNNATSTQSVLIRDASDATTLATLTAGQKAMVWNDGITAFAGVLA